MLPSTRRRPGSAISRATASPPAAASKRRITCSARVSPVTATAVRTPSPSGEAVAVLLGADPQRGEAIEQRAEEGAQGGAQAPRAGLQRPGQQQHRHAAPRRLEHEIGPAVELHEHDGARAPRLEQAGHGGRRVDRQPLVQIGARSPRGVAPAGRGVVRHHHRRGVRQRAQRGDDRPRLLVLADRGGVEPDGAAQPRRGRPRPLRQSPAAVAGRRAAWRRRGGRAAGPPPAPGQAAGMPAAAGAAARGQPWRTPGASASMRGGRGRSAARTASGAISARQARSPRQQGRRPLREQGRQSRSRSSTRLPGSSGK